MIYKRHLSVTILIIICFFSSFYSLFEGLNAIAEAHKEADDMYLFGYKKTMGMYINSAYEFTPDELVCIGQEIRKCNVILEDRYVYFDGYEQVVYNPVILLSQNEALPFPIGHEKTKIPDNVVLVPDSFEIEEKVLYVHGKPIEVWGKIDDETHFSSEMRYTMTATTYFDSYTETFDGHNFVLRISSNENNPYEQCLEIEDKLKAISPHFQVEYSEVDYDKNIFTYADDDSILISILLYLFALINSAIVTYYWVTVRSREISIRKAFGAPNALIWRKMFIELFVIVGTSAVVALISGGIAHMAKEKYVGMKDFICISLGYIIFIFIAVIVSLIIPLKKIIALEPAEGVTSE